MPCSGIEVLAGINYTALHNDNLSGFLNPNLEEMLLIRRNSGVAYAKLRVHDYQIKQHEITNFTKETKDRLDEFFNFVRIITSNKWYKLLTLTIKDTNVKNNKFYRLPFQQLMLLDLISAMIQRHGLEEHRSFIFNFIKDRLGMSWMSTSDIQLLQRQLNNVCSGYVIPRRCGKSSFICSLIALSLCFAPGAGLKTLYTAQKKSLCIAALGTVKNHLKKLMNEFNNYHRLRFLRKRENAIRNIQPFSDHYFQMEICRGSEPDVVMAKFYKLYDIGMVGAGDVVAINEFTSKPYCKADTHRGSTYNQIYIDETNFLMPSIFGELIPNLITGNSKMICTSSQKNSQNTKSFVDLRDVRMKGVLTCVVEYVCQYHCMSMLREENLLHTKCLCNIFSQPLHINTSKDFRKLMTAFSIRKTITNEENVESKTAMLSEIGIVPPGMTKDMLQNLGDISNLSLTNEVGGNYFISNTLDVKACIADNSGEIQVLPTVVCYFDPTPTSYRSKTGIKDDRSLHAMTFTGAMIESNVTHYFVLGVEEFATQQFEPVSHDANKAISTVIMNQIKAIHKIYCGYFTNFILLMEIDSLDLENVWYRCGKLLSLKEYQCLQLVNIFSPCLVSPRKRPLESQAKKMPGHVYDISLSLEELATRLSEEDKYKIGIRMPVDKVQRILDFFSTVFSRPRDYTKCITVANAMVSFSLMGVHHISAHIVRSLDRLVIHEKKNPNGRKTHTISGKIQDHRGKCHQPDDLAISLVLSVSLYKKYAIFNPTDEKERLIRLTPT